LSWPPAVTGFTSAGSPRSGGPPSSRNRRMRWRSRRLLVAAMHPKYRANQPMAATIAMATIGGASLLGGPAGRRQMPLFHPCHGLAAGPVQSGMAGTM